MKIFLGGLSGRSRDFKREGGAAVAELKYSARSALLGRSGGMPPRKILDFRPSEIISGAVLGK